MSSIITAVVKATIGLLVTKGRDKAAEKLKDGDVTEQKFRGLIVREIADIKSKLDGLSRKDLLASISFFEEGIGVLYDVFDKVRSRSDYGTATTQAAGEEAFSLTEGMKKLELIGLDESTTRTLSDAKKRFEDSRRKATDAFSNEALETSDRILAMQYRVMATILEKLDNPEDAIAPCRVCVEQLNSLPAVQSSFDVQLKKDLGRVLGLFGKDERREIISGVCQINRVVYDVTQAVGKGLNPFIWSTVDVGEDKVDPLRDRRLTGVLRKRGMGQCCVTLSFGQEGEEEHKLKEPVCIATNSEGQFIIGDREDCTVKVFDSGGKFVKHFSVCSDVVDTKLYIHGVATDVNDNIYVLVELKKPGTGLSERAFVYKFESNSSLHHQFPVRGGEWKWHRLIVSDSGKVLVLRSENMIDVYENDGEFVRSFGEGTLNSAFNITAATDGRVMVVDKSDSFVRIFSEDGDHLGNFKRQECYRFPEIAFHHASECVVVSCAEPEKEHLHVEIYTRDGNVVCNTQIHEERIEYLRGIAVTLEGRIALVVREKYNCKVLVE